MRLGVNPEKNKGSQIKYKTHRIIIPVFIPESDDEYYKNLFDVFKCSVNSLIKTTDKESTVITIINNACKVEVTNYIDELYLSKAIDKHVKYIENLGKLYSVLSEVKGTFEELITIADADVLYFSNWQSETIKVFNTFKNVGVVAPLPTPQVAFYNNVTLFSNIFLKKKKGKVITNKSLNLFDQSVGNNISISNKKEWFASQYFLEKDNLKVCIGAGHFVASYKGDVLRKLPFKKPTDIFKKGYELEYIDKPIDVMGYYRVSLISTYVYHLGNTIPDWVKEHSFELLKSSNLKFKKRIYLNLPYYFRKTVYRVFKNIIYK
ncbi:hypothetical protein [Polaribacter gochangensis]|uniref:hypothetical protein n=1 Tax=Polaribacter gochangensis TaxID=3252903 RepID=UPI0039047FCC